MSVERYPSSRLHSTLGCGYPETEQRISAGVNSSWLMTRGSTMTCGALGYSSVEGFSI